MKAALILICLAAACASAYAEPTGLEPYYPGVEFKAGDGPIVIEDGDSFWIGIHRVRLLGIDTVEPNQPCEGASQTVDCHGMTMQFVSGLFESPSLVCQLHMGKEGLPLMDDGRYISTCFVGGKELNRMLVEEGFAVAYDPKTSEVYTKAEAVARAKHKGLHKYKFEDPIEYRRRGRTNSCPAQ
ncbi:MAG: thermonuclease family protein [Hyphomonas sp.]|uniref:thermonuclease family protein n=1 Tax=Hyphomonas sp. TaxID=87 RepID=UPI0035289FEB